MRCTRCDRFYTWEWRRSLCLGTTPTTIGTDSPSKTARCLPTMRARLWSETGSRFFNIVKSMIDCTWASTPTYMGISERSIPAAIQASMLPKPNGSTVGRRSDFYTLLSVIKWKSLKSDSVFSLKVIFILLI